MVRAHFPAVEGILVAHDLLHEGVSRHTLDRCTAAILNHFQGVPGEPRIVDDPRSRRLIQEGLGKQSDDVIAVDESAVLVEEETAVEIAVPGDPCIRTFPQHGFGRHTPVLLQHGIWNAVGKRTVRSMVNFDEFERQMRLQEVDDGSGAAVAGVDHHPQGTKPVQFHIAEQVVDVVGSYVDPRDFPGRGRIGKTRTLGQQPDLSKPGVRTDGPRRLPDKLHAIVVGRVVTGCHHDPAVEIAGKGGEVNHLRPANLYVDHIHAGVDQAGCQDLRQSTA